MERGLYAAASSMMAQQTMQDILADNIANASTVGFKQTNITFRAMQAMILERQTDGQAGGPIVGELGMGVTNDKTYTDWQLGPVTQTGNPLDASLGSGQFFAVQTPRGERYTRAGNFQLDGIGNLRTSSGQPVLDAGGQPIQVRGGQAQIDPRGNIVVNGQRVAQLKIVMINPVGLTRDGDSTFAAATPNAVQPAAQPEVRPGTLEQSNVNGVRSMVEMITITRAFDMAHRALTTQDELLRHAAAEVGKV